MISKRIVSSVLVPSLVAGACIIGATAALAPSLRAQAVVDPASDGLWEGPYNWPVIGIHSVLLHDGQVLQFSYNTGGAPGSVCYVYDPRTDTFTNFQLPNVEVFCGGQAFLPDGRVLVNGNINSQPLTHTFDFVNGWVPQPSMKSGLFYPTDVTLPNGNIFTHADTTDNQNEIYVDGQGWHRQNGTNLALNSFPRLFVEPGGDVLCVGPYLGTWIFDRTAKIWQHVADASVNRIEGTAVQLPPNPGRYLVVGGYDAGTTHKSAEILNFKRSTPTWNSTNDMRNRRHHANSTILPDGTILVTGGARFARTGEQPIYEAETFDPETENWTTLSSMTDPRMYHSTATLLPDGRVLVAGGDGYSTAEFFHPTYLFKGPRPTLRNVPADGLYGSTITVDSDQALDIDRVVLMAPGATTHSFNMMQRYLTLQWQLQPTDHGRVRLDVRLPATSDLAPPMYYMLFVVNRDGIPSVGRFIQVH